MPATLSPEIPKIKHDLILFVWFRVLVVAGIYAVRVYYKPNVRQIGVLIPFTILTLLHMLAYWQVGRLATHPKYFNNTYLQESLYFEP